MRSRAPLALMEQTVMVLVFALAAALCLRAFALADGFTATLRAADGTMQAYDAPAALLDAQGERGEGAPLPVCDFSFDESGRLLALNERT